MPNLRSYLTGGTGATAQISSVPASAAPVSSTGAALNELSTGISRAGQFLAQDRSAKERQARLDAKAQKELVEDTAVGKFIGQLTDAAEASGTTEGFRLMDTQRGLFDKAVAENPELGEALADAFASTTGRKVAEMSEEQAFHVKQQKLAWDAHYGSPDLPAELNAREFERWKHSEVVMRDMEQNAKMQGFTDQERKRSFYGSVGKLATLKTESLADQLEYDLSQIASGQPRADVIARWQMYAIQWENEVATRYQDLAGDPVITASTKGVTDMLDLGLKMVDGTQTKEQLNREREIAVARQKSVISASPEGAKLIALSELFANQPALNLPMNNFVSSVVATPIGSASDIRNVPIGESDMGKQALTNMARSENPAALAQGKEHVVSISRHLQMAGLEYTPENIFKVCSVIDQPELISQLTAAERATVVDACQTYATDVAKVEVEDIMDTTLVEFDLSPQGFGPNASSVTGPDTSEFAASEFTDIVFDNAGMRVVAKEPFRTNRKAQRIVQDMNRRMQVVNPVLRVVSNASGSSMEDVAIASRIYTPVGQPGVVTAEENAQIDAAKQTADINTERATGGELVADGDVSNGHPTQQEAFESFAKQGITPEMLKAQMDMGFSYNAPAVKGDAGGERPQGLLDNAGIVEAYRAYLEGI